MQIRTKPFSRAALETVRTRAHVFAALFRTWVLLRLRPRRHPANGGYAGEPSHLASRINVSKDKNWVLDALVL